MPKESSKETHETMVLRSNKANLRRRRVALSSVVPCREIQGRRQVVRECYAQAWTVPRPLLNCSFFLMRRGSTVNGE